MKNHFCNLCPISLDVNWLKNQVVLCLKIILNNDFLQKLRSIVRQFEYIEYAILKQKKKRSSGECLWAILVAQLQRSWDSVQLMTDSCVDCLL